MTSGSYFFDDGQSRKFWSYTIRGKKQTVRHGRLGTKGRESTKSFPSPSAAKTATANLADQKIAKGYVQIDPSLLKVTRPKGKRAATKAQVAKLEKRLAARLPDDYREFLLTQNGGEPESDHVNIPINSDRDSRPVGFIYGLYAKPEPYKSLLFAVENIMPCLPEGHLPICGVFNLEYYSISLDQKPGCVYFWNEDAGGYEVNDDGEPVFDDSPAILVAGSFNEFLTRIAICRALEENDEPASTPANDKCVLGIPEPTNGIRISKRRREEIMWWVYEGGDERTTVFEQGEELMRTKSRKAGEAFVDKYVRKIVRETKQFLKSMTNKNELQYFAENWNWDGAEWAMLELVKNPHTDAGTLLQVYWYSCPEDFCLFHKSLSELDDESDRCTFRIQRHVERKFLKSEYNTASISFDPTRHISMWERRDEFARPIPDIMYQPIAGRKKRT